jgi:hypothetical protein
MVAVRQQLEVAVVAIRREEAAVAYPAEHLPRLSLASQEEAADHCTLVLLVPLLEEALVAVASGQVVPALVRE